MLLFVTLLFIWTLKVGLEILIPAAIFCGPIKIFTSFAVLDDAFDPIDVEVLVFFFSGCWIVDPELFLALLCSFSLWDLFSSWWTINLSFWF